MGLFDGLFGSKKKTESGDRCMECGMTGGQHTEWCPEVHEPVRPAGVAAESGQEERSPRRETDED